jgi:branched-chain amino acid transport system ATP-binding protein
VLNVRNLNTYYGKSHILQNISLEVGKGELVAILGRNGVGKTTLMKSIIRLVPPKSGTIIFEGRDITFTPTWKIARLGIGYVPQGRHIFPMLTVHENLMTGILEGKPNEEDLKNVFELFPQLKGRLNQIAGTLSGGEQQMLAIARALLTNPKLILMDEPTEGLMPILVQKIQDTISAIHDRGISILLVEQRVKMALEIADRILIMERGMIKYEGTPEDLRGGEEILLKYIGVRI